MNIEINKNQSMEEMSSQLPDGITWFFIGQPKTWKTSAASKWSDKGTDGTLIIDADLGADFVPDANNITVTCLNPPTRVKTVDGKVTNKMNWDTFFDPENINLDEPNEPVIKMAQMFHEEGFKIVIFSGRNDRSFHTTVEWLKIHEVPHDLLVMRPDKFKEDSWPIADGKPATPDMRFMPDEILKKKMLDIFVDINDVFLVVDDRDKVVKMWRDLGLNTFQVAPGDF